MSDPEPISWRSIVYGTPVLASDGTRAGTVREVLGSDEDDIFHGLRVTLANGHRDVMVPADEIASLATEAVGTNLTAAVLDGLAAYDEASTYHLASVGWLRKHIGWRDDSKSDEEPG